MCKYCKNLYTGNPSEYLTHADTSAKGVFIELYSLRSARMMVCATIRSVLMNNQGEEIVAEEIIIGWCPVCGRSLKE